MDFSAANTQLWSFLLQFGIIAGILLLANVLRRKIPFIKKTLMPTAVIAGFILLIIRMCGLNPVSMVTLETITYHGIALGFIALSLRIPSEKSGADRLTAPKTGALIVSYYTIYGVIGLIISLGLAYTILPDFLKASGILLAIGYGQGPGQANNIGSMYETYGFSGGRSFALSLAATGYLSACLVGVTFLNILFRKGVFKKTEVEIDSGSVTVNDFEDRGEIPVAESVDKFSIQMALVLGVYLISYFTIVGISKATLGLGEGVSNMISTLLWGFNFIVGTLIAILIRTIMQGLRKVKIITRQYQNNYLLSRISGFAFDLMIIAGIASIEILDLKGLWIPFILMNVAGTVFALTYLLWICKKLYPNYYYEGFLAMFGMSTGTISSGILLVREIDPMFKTPAANNLVTGSGMAIVFGAPMLPLISVAPLSTEWTWAVLGILVVYAALLLLFMLKVRVKAK
jgi:ESS family glutamate:Na+ symporter